MVNKLKVVCQWIIIPLLMSAVFISLFNLKKNECYPLILNNLWQEQTERESVTRTVSTLTNMGNEETEPIVPDIEVQSTSPYSMSEVTQTALSLHTASRDRRESEDLLLVMVISSYKNKNRRDAIRQTWKNSYTQKGKQFAVKFVLGILQLDKQEKESVYTENKEHNDLVILRDHWDSYNNLTRKILQAFIWADQTYDTQYSYIMKVDDDSFVRLDSIESELSSRSSSKELYWGHMLRNEKPHNKGKWKEGKWFLCDRYLPYAIGEGYVLSSELVHRIVLNSDGLILYYNEDVSVGAWISPFDVQRRHDDRFTPPRWHGCSNRYIVMHHQSPSEMRKIHNTITWKGLLCD